MPLQGEIHERWLANLAAAGIDVAEEDLRRIDDYFHGDPIYDFMELIARLDQTGELPDYVRDTVREAAGDE